MEPPPDLRRVRFDPTRIDPTRSLSTRVDPNRRRVVRAVATPVRGTHRKVLQALIRARRNRDATLQRWLALHARSSRPAS